MFLYSRAASLQWMQGSGATQVLEGNNNNYKDCYTYEYSTYYWYLLYVIIGKGEFTKGVRDMSTQLFVRRGIGR